MDLGTARCVEEGALVVGSHHTRSMLLKRLVAMNNRSDQLSPTSPWYYALITTCHIRQTTAAAVQYSNKDCLFSVSALVKLYRIQIVLL